jgi:hypothetical protein
VSGTARAARRVLSARLAHTLPAVLESGAELSSIAADAGLPATVTLPRDFVPLSVGLPVTCDATRTVELPENFARL